MCISQEGFWLLMIPGRHQTSSGHSLPVAPDQGSTLKAERNPGVRHYIGQELAGCWVRECEQSDQPEQGCQQRSLSNSVCLRSEKSITSNGKNSNARCYLVYFVWNKCCRSWIVYLEWFDRKIRLAILQCSESCLLEYLLVCYIIIFYKRINS